MGKLRVCKVCGKLAPNLYRGGLCQKCNDYFTVRGEEVYPLPKEKEVVYSKTGGIICHICGKAFNKLGNHVVHEHGITTSEYKTRFKLNQNTRLTAEEYHNKMSEYNNTNYDKVVGENLLEKGIETRVSSENKIRVGRTHYKVKIKTGVE